MANHRAGTGTRYFVFNPGFDYMLNDFICNYLRKMYCNTMLMLDVSYRYMCLIRNVNVHMYI